MSKWSLFYLADFFGNPLMSNLSAKKKLIMMTLILRLHESGANECYFTDEVIRQTAHLLHVKPYEVHRVLNECAAAFDRDSEGCLFSSKKVKRAKHAERQAKYRAGQNTAQNPGQKSERNADLAAGEMPSKVRHSERHVTRTVGEGLGSKEGTTIEDTHSRRHSESRTAPRGPSASELALKAIKHVEESVWVDACDRHGIELGQLDRHLCALAEREPEMIHSQFGDRGATAPVFAERLLRRALMGARERPHSPRPAVG